MDTLTETGIRDHLGNWGVYPDAVERNPATPGEWVVWLGNGYSVASIEDVIALGRAQSPISAEDALGRTN